MVGATVVKYSYNLVMFEIRTEWLPINLGVVANRFDLIYGIVM